jgi:hypothetical protein
MRFGPAWLLIAALIQAMALASVASGQAPASAEASSSGYSPVVTEAPEAPGDGALRYNAAILDELLTTAAEATIVEQKFAAAAGITGGMVLLGLASWRLIENDPQTQYTRGLGVMFMTLGMVDLTTGVYAAARIPHEKRRVDRWEKAKEDGITDAELAHFEGELQASTESREGERLLVRWNGLTHALAGVLVFALAPIPDGSGRTDRVSAYVVGGIFIATGFTAFGVSFRKTPSEKAWEQYKLRKMPMTGHVLSFRLAPAISRRGFGLSMRGTF